MSFELGIAIALFNIVVGTLWGWSAAAGSTRLNRLLMRLAGFLSTLPLILVAVLARNSWKPGFGSLFMAIGMLSWIPMARMVHKGFLKHYRLQSAFSEPIVSMGFFQKIGSMMKGPLLVTLCLTIPEVVCIEACLSFLGLGVELPYFSLGSLASNGLLSIRYYPWQFFAPAGALMWLVLSMHWISEALQEYFQDH